MSQNRYVTSGTFCQSRCTSQRISQPRQKSSSTTGTTNDEPDQYRGDRESALPPQPVWQRARRYPGERIFQEPVMAVMKKGVRHHPNCEHQQPDAQAGRYATARSQSAPARFVLWFQQILMEDWVRYLDQALLPDRPSG